MSIEETIYLRHEMLRSICFPLLVYLNLKLYLSNCSIITFMEEEV